MSHILAGKNIGLITTRLTKDSWDCLACTSLMGHKALAAYDVNYLFPLYLYPTEKKAHLFDDAEGEQATCRPNLAPYFVKDFGDRLGLTFILDGHGDRQTTFGPEDVFDYLYAVFHSPAYRSR